MIVETASAMNEVSNLPESLFERDKKLSNPVNKKSNILTCDTPAHGDPVGGAPVSVRSLTGGFLLNRSDKAVESILRHEKGLAGMNAFTRSFYLPG
jgi:hypothetical protein